MVPALCDRSSCQVKAITCQVVYRQSKPFSVYLSPFISASAWMTLPSRMVNFLVRVHVIETLLTWPNNDPTSIQESGVQVSEMAYNAEALEFAGNSLPVWSIATAVRVESAWGSMFLLHVFGRVIRLAVLGKAEIKTFGKWPFHLWSNRKKLDAGPIWQGVSQNRCLIMEFPDRVSHQRGHMMQVPLRYLWNTHKIIFIAPDIPIIGISSI